jgi:hypothetical protein
MSAICAELDLGLLALPKSVDSPPKELCALQRARV